MFSLSSMKKRKDFVWHFLFGDGEGEGTEEGTEESLGCSAMASGLEIIVNRSSVAVAVEQ